MVDRDRVDQLLVMLARYVRILRELAKMPLDEYQADPRNFGSAERFLQLAIETALSVGHHIIANAELLVAVDLDGTLLGTVTVCTPGSPLSEVSRPGELEFRMLAVHPEARGSGIGEALVTAVLRRAGDIGAHRVVLCSGKRMHAAHRLYTRLGFSRLSERDWYPVPGLKLLAFGRSAA